MKPISLNEKYFVAFFLLLIVVSNLSFCLGFFQKISQFTFLISSSAILYVLSIAIAYFLSRKRNYLLDTMEKVDNPGGIIHLDLEKLESEDTKIGQFINQSLKLHLEILKYKDILIGVHDILKITGKEEKNFLIYQKMTY